MAQPEIQKTKFKSIGIIGGAGPAASAAFHQKLVATLQSQYRCQADLDFPKITHVSLPFRGMSSLGVIDAAQVQEDLLEGLPILKAAKCEVIALPCNSLQGYRNTIEDCLGIQPIDLVSAVIATLQEQGRTKVTVLGSASLSQDALYSRALEKAGIHQISLSSRDQMLVDDIIENAMGFRNMYASVVNLTRLVRKKMEEGSDAVVLACTELPLVAELIVPASEIRMGPYSELPTHLVDTTQILVNATLKAASQ